MGRPSWVTILEGDMAMHKIWFASVILGFSASLVCAQRDVGNSQEEILRRFRESFAYSQRVSMQVDVVTTSKGTNNAGVRRIQLTHRRDGNRTEWLGESNLINEDGSVVSQHMDRFTNVMNDDYWIRSEQYAGMSGPRGYLRRSFESDQRDLLVLPHWGAHLNGVVPGSGGRNISELLEMSGAVVLHKSMEVVQGVPCYVAESSNKYGRITVWLAPDKGFNAVKYVVQQGPEHFINDELASQRGIQGHTLSVEMDVKEVKGVFLPVSGLMTSTTVRNDGQTITHTFDAKRSEIDLSPDFKALHAFGLNLPDHTFVHDEDYAGIKWDIVGGKLVPYVDEASMTAIEQVIQSVQNDGTGLVGDLRSSAQGPCAPSDSNRSGRHLVPVANRSNQPESPPATHAVVAQSQSSLRVYLWGALAVALCLVGGVLLMRRSNRYGGDRP